MTHPYGPTTTPDFDLLRNQARRMSIADLLWSANDASEAAHCAEEIEQAGRKTLKTGGFYRDEAAFFRYEARKRQEAPQ